ncbi:MAG: putative glycolipid-binding domain-containing protein [Actinomycetes bacterium]|nr:hypothetical protein [Acidimicrobiia bacterium]
MARTMWQVAHPSLSGTELFELDERGTEVTLKGWVVAEVEGVPLAVAYEVVADGRWVTRRVFVTLSSEDRTLVIEHDGDGLWAVDGAERPDLADCRDVDLGISPATNTLPIRRLDLEVGELAHLEAGWVRFPAMTVEPLAQTYERIGPRMYRYTSPGFQRDIEVDDAGVVVDYGNDLWQAVKTFELAARS